MTDSKIGASRSIYYSLSITDDVPDLTEQEREKLEAVMKKAQVDDNNIMNCLP